MTRMASLLLGAAWLAFAPRIALAQEGPQTGSDGPSAPRFNPTGRDLDLMVPVRENGALIGQLRIRLGADDTVAAPVEGLERVLGARLSGEALAAIRTEGADDGLISAAELDALGIRTAFDPQAIELIIELPADSLAPVQINLQGPGLPFIDREFETPAFFSFAANIRSSLDFVHKSSSRETGLNAPIVDVLSFGRVGPVAYEAEFFYDERIAESVVRRGSRLIYDLPQRLIRFTLGDLFTEGSSFQSVPDIGGLSVSRLIDEFPGSDGARPRGQQSFSLDRPSEVRIRINGQEVDRLRLRPGSYDLRNFPFVSGANDVEVEIEDDTGQVQFLRFDFFLDGSLLIPGVQEYYAAVGIRSDSEDGEPTYDTDTPIVTGFYRRGMTDQLTLGANVQATETNQLVGLEAIFSPGVGLFFADAAVSNIENAGSSYGVRVDYRWTGLREAGGYRSAALSVETRGQRFGGVDAVDPNNQVLATIAGRYSQTLSPTLSGNLSFTASIPRDDGETTGTASGGVFWAWGANTRIGATVSYEVREDQDEVRGLFTIRRRLGRRQDISADYDTADERLQLNYNYASTGGIGSWGGSAGLSRSPSSTSVTGTVDYVTSRGDLSANHTASLNPDNEIETQITSLRFSTAVAFADGRFGFGPTLGQSFAILSPHETLEGGEIVIGGRYGDQVRSRSGPLGPALVSLPAYSPSVIFYDVEDAPLGYNFGLGSFATSAPLHAGYPLTVGSEFNVTVLGYLLDYAGEPVVLQSGEARSLEDLDAPVVEIFTNRAGRFGAMGLAPGRWRIRVLTGERLEYDVVVTRTNELLLDVGRLRPRGSAVEGLPP